MPGIDRSRIVGQTEEELDEFVCGICHDILNLPVITPCCQQSYCEDCITEWLTNRKTCPNDRKPLTADRLWKGSRIVVNIINKMKVKCLFSGRGCPSVHTIGEDPQHMKECDNSQCKVCGCSDTDDDHKCLTYLMEEKIKLTEEITKLKSNLDEMSEKYSNMTASKSLVDQKLAQVNKLRNDEIKDTAVLRNENTKLKRDLEVYRDPNLANSIAIPNAIKTARWERPIIQEDRCAVLYGGSRRPNNMGLLIRICQDAISKFDETKQVYGDFTNYIIDQVKANCKNSTYYYCPIRVAVYVNDVTDDYSSKSQLARISFGKLIFVFT